jgi:hypothetical protein
MLPDNHKNMVSRNEIAKGLGIAAFLVGTYFTGNYAVHKLEERVRSESRWYQLSEGLHMGEWADGTDNDLFDARLFGGFLGLTAGALAGLVVYGFASGDLKIGYARRPKRITKFP